MRRGGAPGNGEWWMRRESPRHKAQALRDVHRGLAKPAETNKDGIRRSITDLRPENDRRAGVGTEAPGTAPRRMSSDPAVHVRERVKHASNSLPDSLIMWTVESCH